MSSNPSVNDIFILASRRGIRFPSDKGDLRVDDLWKIPLRGKGTTIETVGNTLLARQQEQKGGSILRTASSNQATDDLNLAVTIIQYIADVRQDEENSLALAASRRHDLQRLTAIIDEREAKETPLDELRRRAQLLATG